MQTIQSLLKTAIAGVSRKFTMIAIILVAVTASAFASSTEVSMKVLNHFNANYAKAKQVTWIETNNHLTKASFVENNVQMEVFYNKAGEVVASSQQADMDDLPRRALKTIEKNYAYPEYTVKECIELTNANDETNYFVSLENSKGEKTILKVSLYGEVTRFNPENK